MIHFRSAVFSVRAIGISLVVASVAGSKLRSNAAESFWLLNNPQPDGRHCLLPLFAFSKASTGSLDLSSVFDGRG